jgi:hypothetical protein
VRNRIAAALNRALVPLVLGLLACLPPATGKRRAAPNRKPWTRANVNGHVCLVAPPAPEPTAYQQDRAPEVSAPSRVRPYIAASTSGAFIPRQHARGATVGTLPHRAARRPDPRSSGERAAQRQRRWALWLALHGIDAEPLRVHGMGVAS